MPAYVAVYLPPVFSCNTRWHTHMRKHNLELAKITKCTFASLLPAALAAVTALADLATVPQQQQHMNLSEALYWLQQ